MRLIVMTDRRSEDAVPNFRVEFENATERLLYEMILREAKTRNLYLCDDPVGPKGNGALYRSLVWTEVE